MTLRNIQKGDILDGAKLYLKELCTEKQLDVFQNYMAQAMGSPYGYQEILVSTSNNMLKINMVSGSRAEMKIFDDYNTETILLWWSSGSEIVAEVDPLSDNEEYYTLTGNYGYVTDEPKTSNYIYQYIYVDDDEIQKHEEPTPDPDPEPPSPQPSTGGTPIKMFKGSEANLSALDVVDGQLIFTTDNKNIYLDAGDERKLFTQAGNDTFVSSEEPVAAKDDVWFVMEDDTPPIPEVIKSFNECSDDELAQYLKLHYEGKIDLTENWHVGDERKIHLNSFNMYLNTVNQVDEQDATITILDINHDDLVSSVNDKDKAVLTLGFKDMIGFMTDESRDSSNPFHNSDVYKGLTLRTQLNLTLLDALPTQIKDNVKEVNKKNLAYHTNTDEAPSLTQDKIWLLSYSELYADTSYDYYVGSQEYEGTQYKYYTDGGSKVKNYQSSPNYYLLRSPSSNNWYEEDDYGYNFLIVTNDGNVDYAITANGYGLAPAFCL